MKTDDFKDRARKLTSRLYVPGVPSDYEVKMTTSGIYHDLCTIIPANALDEFDLVELLEEMGFQPQYEQKERVIAREVPDVKDEDGNPLIEKDVETYDDLVYYWYMKKID